MRERGSGCVDVGAIADERAVAHIELIAVPELAVGVVGSNDLVTISGEAEHATIIARGRPGLSLCVSVWVSEASVVAVVAESRYDGS